MQLILSIGMAGLVKIAPGCRSKHAIAAAQRGVHRPVKNRKLFFSYLLVNSKTCLT